MEKKKTEHGKPLWVLKAGARVIAHEQKDEKKDEPQGAPIYKNPGYPFFVPGVAGHRPPHPPLALGWEEDAPGVPTLNGAGQKTYIDGGLPRHQVLGGRVVREFHTKWDFTKDFIRYEKENQQEKPKDGALVACLIPEEGTPIERAAMNAHATRTQATVQPNGAPGNFLHNGLPPAPGAPYADPSVDDNGNHTFALRRYKAAVIQKNVVFNKQGVHYPQQRFITLWQDVKPTFDQKRAPEPFFFRANGGETVEYWHTNLLPDYYEMDDYQVRTPTDIVGQHIHLVKFDVTASDGAENGFNYEEGTLAPAEVRGRIDAIERPWAGQPDRYGLFAFNDTEGSSTGGDLGVATVDWSHLQPGLHAQPWEGSYLQHEMSQGIPVKPDATPQELAALNLLRPPSGQNWDGAMTTIERFSTDPLLNNRGEDRTVRSVFTHDHFGPSTHQQAGLYGALLVEPAESRWRDPVTGGLYYDTNFRSDGGPTGFEAIIELPKLEKSYREFALEFQDLSLAYKDGSPLATQPSDKLPANASKFFDFTADPGQPPTVGAPVNTFKVAGATSLAELFKANGVSLAPTAKFFKDTKTDTLGIQDLANYNYGPERVAFALVPPDPANQNAKWVVHLPNLRTWANPSKLAPDSGTDSVTPQIISQKGGIYTVNYRSEPLWGTLPPACPREGTRLASKAPNGDQDAFSFASIARDSAGDPTIFDVQPSLSSRTGPLGSLPPLFSRPADPEHINEFWYDPVGISNKDADGSGLNLGQISVFDPMTPLLRAYQNDPVQVRVLVGAYQAPHSLMMHAVKWLHQPLNENSGFRNAQAMGISEHYELLFTMPPATTPHAGPADHNKYTFSDFLYAPSSGTAGLAAGVWGLLRSYDPDKWPLATKPTFPPLPPGTKTPFPPDRPRESLQLLPTPANPRFANEKAHAPTAFKYPPVADVEYDVRASKSTVVYNSAQYVKGSSDLQDRGGMVFSVTALKVKGAPVAGVTTAPGEPLILRARAGEWVKINLTNAISGMDVSLHPSLVGYDVTGTKTAPGSDGANVGFNPVQTAEGPGTATYWWYAGEFEKDPNGDLKPDADGAPLGHPIEFGAINLLPPGYLTQPGHGLVGALIVEPADASWAPKHYVSAQAEIKRSAPGEKTFTECVLIEQNNVTARATVPVVFDDTRKTAEGTATSTNAVNLRSEPFSTLTNGLKTAVPSPVVGYRTTVDRNTAGDKPIGPGVFLSDSFVSTYTDSKSPDPQTPVFGDDKNGKIFAGDPVRLRVLRPGGDVTPNGSLMFELHGHSWQQEPWTHQSLRLGDNPDTQTLGAEIVGPFEALNILLDSAGGPEKVPGDYLYYNYPSPSGGSWGIFRVTDASKKPKTP